MKMPEPCPEWKISLSNHPEKILEANKNPEMVAIIEKANEEYWHWDKVKYRPLPEGWNQTDLWTAIKWSRLSAVNNALSAVDDINNKPFVFWIPDAAAEHLHFIDKNAGGEILLDEPGVHDAPSRDRYVMHAIMEEAISSSVLEGADTTRQKARALLRSGEKAEGKSEQMIVNNYHTIQWLQDKVGEPLSPELIQDMHRHMTEGTLDDPFDAGRFQMKGENRVWVADRNTGEVLFKPPPAEEITARVQKLCAFANALHKKPFVHPIVKAILLHFGLAYIHPFVDGNGRTARALFYWFVLKEKYWLFQYISISTIILKAPSQYQKAYLYSEHDDLDATYFIMFHLRIIRLAVAELHLYLERRQKEIREAKNLNLKHLNFNLRQRELLRHALQHPDAVYSIKEHQAYHQTVYQTARMDLLNLEKRKFLTRFKIGAEFFFKPVKDLTEKVRVQ